MISDSGLLFWATLYINSIHILSQHGGPKNGTVFLYALLHQILTDFQTYFTVRIWRKFVIILSLTIPTTPQMCRYTISCEMSVS